MVKFSAQKVKKLAEKYGLADVYIFGSQVSGFQRKESDVDIGVRFKKGLPEKTQRAKTYGDIFSDLGLCFEGKKVDLVFIEEVPLHFQFKIVSEGKLIYYKNLDDSLNFVEKTVNYYRDYKYFIDEYFKGVLEAPMK